MASFSKTTFGFIQSEKVWRSTSFFDHDRVFERNWTPWRFYFSSKNRNKAFRSIEVFLKENDNADQSYFMQSCFDRFDAEDSACHQSLLSSGFIFSLSTGDMSIFLISSLFTAASKCSHLVEYCQLKISCSNASIYRKLWTRFYPIREKYCCVTMFENFFFKELLTKKNWIHLSVYR